VIYSFRHYLKWLGFLIFTVVTWYIYCTVCIRFYQCLTLLITNTGNTGADSTWILSPMAMGWRPSVADWGDGVSAIAVVLVQLSISVGNRWPHNALWHHWLMPISCHFRDCKALLLTSHYSGRWRYSKCPDLYLCIYGWNLMLSGSHSEINDNITTISVRIFFHLHMKHLHWTRALKCSKLGHL